MLSIKYFSRGYRPNEGYGIELGTERLFEIAKKLDNRFKDFYSTSPQEHWEHTIDGGLAEYNICDGTLLSISRKHSSDRGMYIDIELKAENLEKLEKLVNIINLPFSRREVVEIN